MGLFRGIGARLDAVRGTSPIEVRKVLAGLFASAGGIGARAGILPGGTDPLVTGDATWAYNVGQFHVVASRGASDGVQVYGNDGSVLIGATGVGSTVPVAPGAGLQRIDIAWTRHPANTENADTASEPLFGVASGTAVSSGPVAPSIPAGAVELGRNLMTSAATSTASAGNTITQTALYTALRGAPVPFRNQVERDAYPSPYDGLEGYRLDTHVTEMYNGTAWVATGPKIAVYALVTAGVSVATGGTAVVTSPAIIGDGAKAYKITASWPYTVSASTGNCTLSIRDVASGAIKMSCYVFKESTNNYSGRSISVVDVPSAGSKTYELFVVFDGGVAGTAIAGATQPISIVVEQIT